MVKTIEGNRVGRFGKITVVNSASIIDPKNNKILLIKREDNGKWACPAGYMEAGESVTEGCAREVLEETGLEVKVNCLIGVYSNPNLLLEYPDGNKWQVVVLHFLAEVIGGNLINGDEVTDVGYFSHLQTQSLDLRKIDRKRIDDTYKFEQAAILSLLEL